MCRLATRPQYQAKRGQYCASSECAQKTATPSQTKRATWVDICGVHVSYPTSKLSMRCCCRSEAGGPLCRIQAPHRTGLAQPLVPCAYRTMHECCTNKGTQHLRKPAISRWRTLRYERDCARGQWLVISLLGRTQQQIILRPQAEYTLGLKSSMWICTGWRRQRTRMSRRIKR